ncbi:MAG: MBL fold metallo-hydrolase [Roseibium sp.]|uniref:MBL fold metallo-hydrolase n=1 Tax=Roseibium sp. TaxID=1936156 RepID=UPI00260500E1|nr:MBL fold metallo-hydrolase [Roseibium sp.]MCV0427789.1 MBL fold metallo-hydrolase [Roseibium sp.]
MKRRSFIKTAAGFSLVAPATISGFERARADTNATETGLSITWLGAATLLLSCGDLTVVTDPCFGDGNQAFRMGDPNEMFELAAGPNIKFHRRLTPFQGLDLDKVDRVILSHMHEDHFDQKAEQDLRKDIPILAPAHDVETLRSKGFEDVTGLNWGDQHVIRKGDVTISLRAIRADHSENPVIAKILGPGNGYWLIFQQGDFRKSLYWTGDTFPTSPVLEALQPLGAPEILIPHLGGVGTTGSLGKISMGAEELALFADALNPGKILPVHHSTYDLYLEPAHHVAEALSGRTNGLDFISEGTVLKYL